MFIYEGIKTEFLNDVERDTIAVKLKSSIYEKMHRSIADNEYRSWENSLLNMYKVLNDGNIPADSGIAIEYNIPQTSMRIDFLISGYSESNRNDVVIVELKQWEKIKMVEGNDALVETYTGNALRNVVHPSYQAWSYSMMIKDYNEAVQNGKIGLLPCSYMHNYRRIDNDPIDNMIYDTYLTEAPVFTKGEVEKLRAFIKKYINKGDNKQVLYLIENGKIKPSKSLQDSIAGMLHGNREFIMIDDQKVVYEEVRDVSKKSKNDNKKRVVIIKGGPGTGKTVVAVNLLSALTNDGQVCQYVTKNSTPRNVFLKKLKGKIKKNSVDNMFKSSGIYTDVSNNAIDTILADEAHRLNAKSGMFSNYGENQIKEIINAAKCSVFFIDERQKVTMKDIGSVQEIEKWAKKAGAQIYYNELVSQFRCNGSDGYLAWIDDVLGIRETANFDLEGVDFDIRVFDSPNDIRDMIIEKNKDANRARILAGYCWDWLKEGNNSSEVHDIKIGDFEISWNLKNTSTYAIDENSVNEAGCIHTSQGLEFDYVGVIIGEDMRYENGCVVTDFKKRAKTDQSLKGIKELQREDPKKAEQIADEIIKNTYRTLMTRGMKGCYIYCVDSSLQEYFKKRARR
jgi:hypothetical protein